MKKLAVLVSLFAVMGIARGFYTSTVTAGLVGGILLSTATPASAAPWNKKKILEEEEPEPTPEDVLAFLVADIGELRQDIAKNWGFIFCGGVVKILAGFLALSLPLVATEVAYVSLALTIFVTGAFNAVGVAYEEPGFKIPSLLAGLAQMFLAYRMYYKPFTSLIILTMYIAGTSVVEGVFQAVVALKNQDIPGWGSFLFSGVVSVLAGIFVTRRLVASSLVVLGIVFGSHLISGGWASIAVAMEGREIALESLVG